MRHRLGRFAIASILAVSITLPMIKAQENQADIDESLDDLLSGALAVHIHARIIDQDQNETVWTMDLTRVTVSGRSVRVHLEGSNISVVADFTPYWEDDGQLVLVAQGRTWLTNDDDADEPDYRTSFTTLPIQLGEPIIFLPLGDGRVPVDTERFGRLNIELEINVERYQS
ncbi:MAG: hypothetical protein ACOCYB_09270 [Alkalispirochaeta sp.]